MPRLIPSLVASAPALILVAALLATSGVARAADDADAWREIAEWIQSNVPDPATKASTTRYGKEIAKRVEGFLEAYPDSSLRVDAEQVLGTTYLKLEWFPKALKLYEAMAEGEGRRAALGRYGVVRALIEQNKLKDARKRLDAYMAANPDDKDLPKLDEWLKKQSEFSESRKALDKLKAGDAFGEVEGRLIGSGEAWRLSEKKGKLTLVGFYMAHQDGGRAMPSSALKEVGIVQDLVQKHGEDGLVAIGIPLDGDADLLAAWLEKEKVTFPQMADGRAVSRDFGVARIPYWVLLDGDGRVIDAKLRYNDMKKVVTKALKALP